MGQVDSDSSLLEADLASYLVRRRWTRTQIVVGSTFQEGRYVATHGVQSLDGSGKWAESLKFSDGDPSGASQVEFSLRYE